MYRALIVILSAAQTSMITTSSASKEDEKDRFSWKKFNLLLCHAKGPCSFYTHEIMLVGARFELHFWDKSQQLKNFGMTGEVCMKLTEQQVIPPVPESMSLPHCQLLIGLLRMVPVLSWKRLVSTGTSFISLKTVPAFTVLICPLRVGRSWLQVIITRHTVHC